MRKRIPKPDRYEDFEDLCLRIFQAEFNSPFARKNGRPGQKQDGVDISGKFNNTKKYYAIQCKSKDGDKKSKLTKQEIDNEVKNAIKFRPLLTVLIFATTSEKDIKIEQYIREKDISLSKEGLFGCELWSWDELEDLLNKHNNVKKWYDGIMGFSDDYNLIITLNNKMPNETIILYPEYEDLISFTQNREINYEQKDTRVMPLFSQQISVKDFSRCGIEFTIKNQSKQPIDIWEICLNIKSVDTANIYFCEDEYSQNNIFFSATNILHSIEANKTHLKYTCNRGEKVCDEQSFSFSAFIKLPSNECKFNIYWKILTEQNCFTCGNKSFQIVSKPLITVNHKGFGDKLCPKFRKVDCNQ